jgi:peptidyl-tRNA hydrolase, PTH1 family
MTIRLLVGLGNPGAEYEHTRHNAGFWWIDAVASKLRASLVPERSYHGLVARINRTFMNVSGKSVAALARFFKIAAAEIVVAHDELDLQPGQARLKLGGSAAGHNGLKDIHAQLGTQDFWRLRLGIGHPGVKAEVPNYVLKKPSAEHRTGIEQAIERSLESLDLLLAGDMTRAMMKVHADKPERPKPPRPAPPTEEEQTP